MLAGRRFPAGALVPTRTCAAYALRARIGRLRCHFLKFQKMSDPGTTNSLDSGLHGTPRSGEDLQVVTRPPRTRIVPQPLDETSKRIIEQLQEDGRRPYAAIGKAVGLSEAAVRQRVQRLLDAGVMQIVAVTDPMQVGFARQAMIGIRVEGDISPVAEALAAMTEVDYVVVTAGSFDVLVEVVCEDDDHLLDVVARQIRSVPGVQHTETFVYLKLRKQLYNWGTR